MKTFVRKYFKKIASIVDELFMPLCSRYKKLSDLYYFLFSNSFSREHQSVLAGKMKYLRDVRSENSSFYQLVRNTHRIEKGLLMKPRRSIFALDYIEETIDSFEKAWEIYSDERSDQLKWSHNVLELYFKVTNENDLIDTQRKRFKKIIKHNHEEESEDKSVPYRKKKLSNIDFDEFYKLTLQRRSMRWFEDKKVPRQLIDKAISAAIQSPSACNRQPFEYRIIDQQDLLKEIVHFPGGTIGYAENIPVLIVAVGNLDAYFSERDRHLIYIDASLANMSLMLALETLGLSSCAINWPDVEKREKKMETFLNLKKYQRPIMCIAVGYADTDGMVAFSEKKDISKIRKYN